MGRKKNIIHSPDQQPIDFEDPEFFDADNLSPRHLSFCQHYAIHQNAVQAYMHAFYPAIKKDHPDYKKCYRCACSRAHAVLEKVGIKDAIRKFMRQRAIKMQVDADYILHAARELVERGLGNKKPLFDPQTGTPTGEYVFDSNSVSKGLAVSMRHSTVSTEFTEKIQVTHKDKLSEKLASHQASLRKK